MEPSLSAVSVVELQNDDAFRIPITFQDFAWSAADDVFAPVLLHCRTGSSLVFFVLYRLGYFQVDDDVSRHVLSCARPLPSRNHDPGYDAGNGTNDRAESERKRCARPMRDRPGLQASQRNHGAKNEGPNAHDATTHFVGYNGLQHRVRSRE